MTATEAIPGRGCVVVPAYHEAGRIGEVIRGIRRHLSEVIVVDDGSADDTGRQAEAAGATVIRHETNLGKGAALETGFRAARKGRFGYVITLDGDGQHAPDDIPRFLAAYAESGVPVLVGNRMGDTRAMPLVRRLTNRFMSWLLSREMGQRVPDTQCGYRLYQLDVIPEGTVESERFAAESELLMELSSRGCRIGSVPVATRYGSEQSKIRPFRDSLRFFAMLRRLRKKRQSRS